MNQCSGLHSRSRRTSRSDLVPLTAAPGAYPSTPASSGLACFGMQLSCGSLARCVHAHGQAPLSFPCLHQETQT
ncbi:Histone-lysine N-methyltransferase MECOM [Manis javanica]|nr:Histone-lysine N-methyltransferase MECOM [Manis javanica]